MPIVVPKKSSGVHRTSSAVESAERLEDSIPEEQKTVRACRNALQDLSEWLVECVENVLEPASTSSGSDQRDPPVPPRPGSSTSQSIEGETRFVHACLPGSQL